MPRAPTESCRGFSKRGIYLGRLNIPQPHPAPHTPLHAVCSTDMWWVVQNSLRNSTRYRNGTLPLHPRHIPGFSSYIEGQVGAPPHWVHCVLLGSLLTTVAVQPGRCRRFIGTLLARIKHAPRTLRMEDKRRSESIAADRENKNTILRKTISRLISWKNCAESFQDFAFCRFGILKFRFLRI
jgi:hypothetical protein